MPSAPASTEIGAPLMALPFASTRRKSTRLFVLLGATTAGTRVPVRLAPVTANDFDVVSEPLVAVTVMMRLEGSEPMPTVAVDVPLAAVVGDESVKVAPLSTENETGMPVSDWPAA